MDESLFLLDTISITPDILLNILFNKEMNYRELIECYIQIKIILDDKRTFKRTKKLRYVYDDKIISFDKLMNFINLFLKEIIETIEAINSGINLSPDFYLRYPGLDNTTIEIRKEIKKSIESINEYRLQPFIIKLYTILTSFKGTDTLQKRKYKKMIEHQEASILYHQKGEY